MGRSGITPALVLLLVASIRLASPEENEKDRKKVVPATMAELEQEIREVLQETKTPGVGVALVSRDRTLWTAGIGMADVASGKKTSPETLFRIGSISKMFVSLSVLMLVEEGKLRLDGVVRDLAPEIAFLNRWEASDPIRVVHLLEHTTGFDDLAFREYAHNDPSPITLREALDYNPNSRRASGLRSWT